MTRYYYYELALAVLIGMEFGLWQQNWYAGTFMVVLLLTWLVGRK